MILLDTSVVVDHLRGVEPATVLLEGLLLGEEDVMASELTRFELLAGAHPEEMDSLEQFCSVLGWVPVTDGIARQAGAYARAHRRSHTGIGAVDYLLAGTATVLSAQLITLNVRHFPMFDGLAPPYRSGDAG